MAGIPDKTADTESAGLKQLPTHEPRFSGFLRSRLPLYSRLIRFNRPIGTLLLLWPTLWALWVASEGLPTLHLFLVFSLGVFLTRSAGCIMNDIADRDIDRHVQRTSDRPLTTDQLELNEALMLMALLLFLAFLLVLTTNHLTVLLAFVGILLAFVYPFMKRITYIPQFILGMAFGWGIPMAFAATSGNIPKIAWLLYLANIIWAMIYDTMYAMVDREDDMRLGLKSTAILFDDADTAIIGIMQLMFIAVLVIAGRQLELGIYYFSGIFIVSILCVYQQYLINDREPEMCFRAFLNNNYVGMAVFLGVFAGYFN